MLNNPYQGMSYEVYAELCKNLNAVRSSMVKSIKKSPRHLKWEMDHPREESDALRIGKNVHLMFENTEEFQRRLVHVPVFVGKTKDGKDSTRSKEAAEKKADFLAGLPPDAIIASDDEMDMYAGILNSMREKKFVNRLLKDSIKEVSLFVEDPETGLTLACRPDFITNLGDCCDLKTTRNASHSAFRSAIFSDSPSSPFYILQAAHYAYCMKIAGLGDGKRFTFVAIEKEGPHDFAVYTVDEGHLDIGERWRKKLTKTYADCLQSGRWPGYVDGAQSFDLPAFASLPPLEEDEI